ncbi:MAG: type IV pilus secretin PilQ [Deltaproteobacteria bacterium]|nr:type IV pilus secretin PilQ [Deltaproteobacteria bacterium]MCB9788451.1 type IV pilus secretin PilQ [Deltaproteobacteria bacterium]
MMRLPSQIPVVLTTLMVAATVAPVSASPRAANAIQRIQVREASDQTIVEIESQAKPTFTVFKLADPPRLFVDVVGADVSALEATMNVSNGVIGRIHALQYNGDVGEVGRIVIEFEQNAAYDIKTVGSTIRLMVDGTQRTAPDLRLKAAEVEARRIEQAIERERKLLADLKSARADEERLRVEARNARVQEEKLTAEVAKARAEAERLSKTAQREADKVQSELELLKKTKELEQAKADALARAVRAEQARKTALEEARQKATALQQAMEEARTHQEAMAASGRALEKREAEEATAREALAKAQAERDAVAAKLAEATAAGRSADVVALDAELGEKMRAVRAADEVVVTRREATNEARLARAQAQEALREANLRRDALEEGRRVATGEAADQEKKRTEALGEAVARRDETEATRRSAAAARESALAQQRLAALEKALSEQRGQVEKAQEQSEVEQARIALLKDQLTAEQDKLSQLKSASAVEEAKVDTLKKEVAGLEDKLSETEARTKAAEEAYQRQMAAIERIDRDGRAAAEANQTAAMRTLEAARAAEAAKAERALAELEAARAAQAAEAAKAAEAQRALEAMKVEAAKAAEKRAADAKLADAKRAADAKAAAADAKAAAAERKAEPAPEPKAAPKVAARPVITDLNYRESHGNGRVEIALTEDAAWEVTSRSPRRLELQLRGTVIPRELERSLDTAEFAGPVKLVSSFRSADEPGTVRVVVDLREAVRDEVELADGKLVWSFVGAATASSAPGAAPGQKPGQRLPPGVHAFPGLVAAQGGAVGKAGAGGQGGQFLDSRRRRAKRKYSGKKINLTIKDADIQHVLTFLAKEGGVNIVAADDVTGKVTFHLENIPWDLALDMILKTQGYDYVKEYGVYRVAKVEDIQKEFESELKRKQTIEELKPLVVRFITVNYASLEEVTEHIKTVLSKNGTVSADSATSTLIVKDTEEHVIAAEDIVRRLDVQLPQVLIEARIVEASTSFSRELGVQWGGNFTMSPAFGNPTGLAFPSVIGISGGADDGTAPTNGLLTSNPNFAVNLPAAAGAGAGGALGLTLGSLGGAANLNLRLSAAEDTGQVKIISAPKILTIDGKKASIRQGVSIPISVVSANGVNTQFFNAELKLEVQTNTSPDGNIRLDLDITKNEPDFGQTSANGAPTIQKKEAHTSLLVRDGDTTVIGGIFTRNTGSSNAKVPFLSKIPILGWFFQNHRETDNRSELLIFITPRIANRRASLVDGGGP